MTTYFISGHLDLSWDEFDQHYKTQIEEGWRQGLDAGVPAQFIVGDARGCDKMAQEWLWKMGARATVYHMLAQPRFNIGFPTIGGFTLDRLRDEAMTVASDEDIAWVRQGRENSGTALNLARRKWLRSG